MSNNSIEIISVKSRRERNEFIKFPWKIYKNDPNWVPPLIVDMKKMMNPKKCPFFEHSEAEFFLARRDGKTVGRIAAIKNNRHNEIHQEKHRIFWFFRVD